MSSRKLESIVIATHNSAKRERYGKLLSGVAESILSLTDLGINVKPAETGETAEENSRLKASFYSQLTKRTVFCEDEALYVDFLPNDQQPGVHVRRINRLDEVDDEKLLAYWDAIVSRTSQEKRTGRWRIAYSLATPDGRIRTAVTDHEVMFFSPPSSKVLKGWPLSSIQGSRVFRKPSVEYTPEEREQRQAEANKVILEKLEELLNDKVNKLQESENNF